MVAIESVQLRENLFMRVDKYPYGGINPTTHTFEDLGVQHLFSLYEETPSGNILVANCILRDDRVMERFGVHRDFYGKGYGTMLIDYVKAFAKTKGYASIIAYIEPLASIMQFFSKRGFKFNIFGKVTINNKTLVKAEIPIEKRTEPIEMMSYRNGHNPSLVDKINWIGNDEVRKPLFLAILKFLAESYGNECRENACFKGEVTDDIIEQYGYDILTNVLDDTDLETIISHCRIGHMIAGDDNRFKSNEEVIKHFNQKFPH